MQSSLETTFMIHLLRSPDFKVLEVILSPGLRLVFEEIGTIVDHILEESQQKTYMENVRELTQCDAS